MRARQLLDRSAVLLLLQCLVGSAGGQRELLGWSQQTRISNTSLGHLYPNNKPQEGTCLNGTIVRHLVAPSVTSCELMCGRTPGCRWFAYCASHLDVSLPVEHALVQQYCDDTYDMFAVEPASAFGRKRDKCVLYSECLRVGMNSNGTVPYAGFYIYQYSPRSVMTGRHTDFFPEALPDSLKVRFHVPDSLHPNLRFWFTPDQLDEEGHANGERIKIWRNVANICYRGHPEYMMEGKNLSFIRGNCSPSRQELYQRGQWPQEYGEVTNFVQTLGNSQKEILYQHDPAYMPQYRTKQINGHSALHFRRKDTDGGRGKFMYMYTMLGDKQGFQDESRNPFASQSDQCSNVPSYRGAPKEFTIFVVVKTFSKPGDRYFHGILNIIGGSASDRWKGLSIFKNSATCSSGKTPSCHAYTSFSALDMVFGVNQRRAYLDCSEYCGRQACSLSVAQLEGRRDCSCAAEQPHAACVESWGPDGARHAQDPDVAWRLVSIRVRDQRVEGFIDGFHASPKPPLLFENEDAFELTKQFRIGLLDEPGSARSGFLNGDIAEMLIYNKALTNQEMDRIANYLTVKFKLSSVRLDDDVASPSRSVTLNKMPGCGGNMALRSVCNEHNKNNTPYSTEGRIEIYMGEPFEVNRGYCPNPAPDKRHDEIFSMAGWYLLPTDLDTSGPHRVVPSDVSDVDLVLHEQYLLVTIGEDEATEAHCRIHTAPAAGSFVCTSTGINWGRMQGVRHGLPVQVATELMNASNVLSRLLVHDEIVDENNTKASCMDGDLKWVYPSTGDGTDATWPREEDGSSKPVLRCHVHGGIQQGKQVNIYWHGK